MSDKVVDLFLSGYTSLEISEKYNISVNEIARILSEYNQDIFIIHKEELNFRIENLKKSYSNKEISDMLHIPVYKIEK